MESLPSSGPLRFWSGVGLDEALCTLDRPQRLGQACFLLLPPRQASLSHLLQSLGEPQREPHPTSPA